MLISRKYDSTTDDLQHAIDKGNDIIVGVDREKLYVEPVDLEDSTNHAVIVTELKGDSVTLFDPYKTPQQTEVPLPDFMNAWKESHHYMVQVLQSVSEYEPHPIDVDAVPLDGDLVVLQEAIAENAHNVWAQARIRQGWTYGREWDDTKKHDPSLVPFTSLPDSERDYDRLTAFNTIKLVKKLGFDIVKRKKYFSNDRKSCFGGSFLMYERHQKHYTGLTRHRIPRLFRWICQCTYSGKKRCRRQGGTLHLLHLLCRLFPDVQ